MPPVRVRLQGARLGAARRTGLLIVAALGLGVAMTAPARAEETAEVDVYFHDQVGLFEPMAREIHHEVGEIYSRAGVRVRWLKPQADTQVNPRSKVVRLVLAWKDRIEKKLLKKKGTENRVLLGVGWRTDGDPEVCTTVVLPYDELVAVSRAAMNLCQYPAVASPGFTRVAARVAAHEIGHVLLNRIGHSASGLMRPTFSFTELVSPFDSDFQFSPEDAARLQQALRPPD